jgi:O-antigen/teichoic acid export membrane protein
LRDRDLAARSFGGVAQPQPVRDSELRRGVLRSTSSNLTSRAVMIGTWFFLTPFMVDHLGTEKYGLWALIGSITAFGGLFDLGISASIVKFVAEHRARGEVEELRALIATCQGVFFGIGAILILVGAILAPFVPDIFNVAPDERGTASWTLLAAGATAGISIPMSVPNAVLSGLQRFDLVAFVSIVSMGLFAASTVAVLLAGGGLVVLVLSGIPVRIVSMALSRRFVHRLAPEIRFGLRGFERRTVRRVASFSWATFALESSSQLETKTDEIVIGGFLPVASVGPYAIARRLSSLPELLTAQFTGVLMPLSSELEAQGSTERVKMVLVAGTRVALASFLPIGLGLVVLADPFLSAWVGPAFGHAARIVVVLSGAAAISTMLGPSMVVSLGTNRHRVLAVFAVAAGLLNLGLSIVLIQPYGTFGVALGTLIAVALRGAVTIPYLERSYSVGIRTAVGSILVPVGLPALPTLLVLFVLRQVVDPATVLSVLLIGAAGGLVYACGYLAMPSCTGERELLRHAIGRARFLRMTPS